MTIYGSKQFKKTLREGHIEISTNWQKDRQCLLTVLHKPWNFLCILHTFFELSLQNIFIINCMYLNHLLIDDVTEIIATVFFFIFALKMSFTDTDIRGQHTLWLSERSLPCYWYINMIMNYKDMDAKQERHEIKLPMSSKTYSMDASGRLFD